LQGAALAIVENLMGGGLPDIQDRLALQMVRPDLLRHHDASRTVTDIDFLAYDQEKNEAALFQLKWQHNAGVDTRARRSAARNLVTEGNRWIGAVADWLDRYGANELGCRAGLDFGPNVHIEIFVLADTKQRFRE
jgi:hypothetical protein